MRNDQAELSVATKFFMCLMGALQIILIENLSVRFWETLSTAIFNLRPEIDASLKDEKHH